MNKTKEKKRNTDYSGSHVSVLELAETYTVEESVNFDETHRGVEIVVDILVVVGGRVGEKVCGSHLKYSYNVCKISLVPQAK